MLFKTRVFAQYFAFFSPTSFKLNCSFPLFKLKYVPTKSANLYCASVGKNLQERNSDPQSMVSIVYSQLTSKHLLFLAFRVGSTSISLVFQRSR